VMFMLCQMGAEKQEEVGTDFNRPSRSFCCIHFLGRSNATTPIRRWPVILIHHQDWPYFPPDRACGYEVIVYHMTVIRSWQENGCRWTACFFQSRQGDRQIH